MSGTDHHNKLIQYQKRLGTLVEIIIILNRLNCRKRFKMISYQYNSRMMIYSNLRIPIVYNL